MANKPLELWCDAQGNVTLGNLRVELLPLYTALGGAVPQCPSPLSPRFLTTRRRPVPLAQAELATAPIEQLWKAHRCAGAPAETRPEVTLLDVKAELARRLLTPCVLCEHRCAVDRDQELGWCRTGATPHLAEEFIHYGEEPGLVPSHTIYLGGCNMRCDYCTSHQMVEQPEAGQPVTPRQMAKLAQQRAQEGAGNVNWLGGEPTIHLPLILDALREDHPEVAVVWNSNMYMVPEVLDLLDQVVDVYVADLKFGPGNCAQRIAHIPRYWAVVTRNLLGAAQQAAQLIVRHLAIPQHLECCTHPVLTWLSAHLPQAEVSLLGYRPAWRTLADSQLGRLLTEAEQVRSMAAAAGLHVVADNLG